MESISLLDTVPDAFLVLLRQYCLDSRNDPLSSIADLNMASTAANKLSFEAIQELDFSYMAWYGHNKDVYPALKISGYEPLQRTVKIQRDWSQERRSFFLRHLGAMKNLRSLNLSGMSFPTEPSERHSLLSVIGSSLPALRELRLASVTVLFPEDFEKFLFAGNLGQTLKVLDISWNNQLGTSVASLIGERCPNLEELYWAMTDFWNAVLMVDPVTHFKALCRGCKRLRKFIAPGFAKNSSEWVAELSSNKMELLGLCSLKTAWNFPWVLNPDEEPLSFLKAALPRVGNDINRIVLGSSLTRKGLWVPMFANIHSMVFQQFLFEQSIDQVEAKVRRFLQSHQLPEPSKPFEWDMPNTHGLTPLALAACEYRTSSERFAELRDRGADPTKLSGIGFTPFALATVANNRSFPKNLEEYLAGNPADAPRVETLGFTLLHAYMLFSDVRTETEELLEKIEDYHIGINDKDMFGYTALHYAVLRNHHPEVRLLLAKGADIWQRCNIGTKDSAIHTAIRYGCYSSVFNALLPDQAALDVAIQNLATEWRLLLILFMQRQDLLKQFIRQEQESLGEVASRANAIFPIYVAASRGGKKLLRALLAQERIKSTVSVNEKITSLHRLGLNNGTVLHLAALQNRPAIVRTLLAHGGADAGALDSHGRTPLMIACKFRAGIKCVPVLLDAMRKMDNFEAVLNQAERDRKYTALHWTSTWKAEDADVLRALLKTPGLDLRAKDADSRTIFDWIVKHRFQYYHWKCEVKFVFDEMSLS